LEKNSICLDESNVDIVAELCYIWDS